MIKSYMSSQGYIAFLIEWCGVQSIMISYNFKNEIKKDNKHNHIQLRNPLNEIIEK